MNAPSDNWTLIQLSLFIISAWLSFSILISRCYICIVAGSKTETQYLSFPELAEVLKDSQCMWSETSDHWSCTSNRICGREMTGLHGVDGVWMNKVNRDALVRKCTNTSNQKPQIGGFINSIWGNYNNPMKLTGFGKNHFIFPMKSN